MKKGIFLIISLLPFILYSCLSNEETSLHINEDVKTISITIADMEEETPHSRMNVVLEDKIRYRWEANDTIGIFPSKGGQVEFPIEGNGGETSARFDGGGWGLKTDYSYSAYYPFNFYNRKATAVPISYLGQKQNGTGELARKHLSNYAVLATPPVTVEETALNFTLNHVGAIIILHLTMPEANTYTSATLYTDSKVIPVLKTINLMDEQLPQTSTKMSDRLTIDLENVTTQAPNQEIELWIAFPTVSESTHTLNVVVYDKYGIAYSGEVYKKDKETVSDVVFKKNTYYNRYASPILTENFNFGVKKWDQGSNIQGSVQQP